MATNSVRWCAALVLCGWWTGQASAVVLFSDDFNANTSANWTINKAPAATDPGKQQATFAYDYSAMGIPPAPGSVDTLGLRLRANLPLVGGMEVTSRPAGTTSGLSMSPTAQSFGTSYKMTVYAWSNFFGAPNASGLADNANSEGGTQNTMFAIGTSGTVPLVVGNTGLVTNGVMDGIGFATTGDGGITNDYRVYPANGTIVPGTTPGVYAAGSTDNGNAFYTALFPAQMAPAVQQVISTNEYGGDASNTQLGSMQAGSFGFAWHKVEITKNGNIITWEIDDEAIATYDASTTPLGGSNIALGQSDVNTTTARHPSLVFTVFDNLLVSTIGDPIAGDFDHDFDVDAMDLFQWQGDFGANADSDADGDTDSDGADFLIWQRNQGAVSSAAAATGVPEPAAAVLAALGGMSLFARRQSSSRR